MVAVETSIDFGNILWIFAFAIFQTLEVELTDLDQDPTEIQTVWTITTDSQGPVTTDKVITVPTDKCKFKCPVNMILLFLSHYERAILYPVLD